MLLTRYMFADGLALALATVLLMGVKKSICYT